MSKLTIVIRETHLQVGLMLYGLNPLNTAFMHCPLYLAGQQSLLFHFIIYRILNISRLD